MTARTPSPLVAPLQIGRMTVAGRLYKSATSETRATDEGYVTDELLEFYEPMVRARTPLIVTGNLFVSLQAKSAGGQAGIDIDDKKPGLREWVELAHSGGSLLIAQLNHGGRQMVRPSDPGKATVPASSVREPLYGTTPRPFGQTKYRHWWTPSRPPPSVHKRSASTVCRFTPHTDTFSASSSLRTPIDATIITGAVSTTGCGCSERCSRQYACASVTTFQSC
ncbi:hypothetical protein RW1_005_00950 [Rhodococcus wratislaviensis NBRC 100605]|uniref:NADH:flavin oxidoreductase/NADH oxidase N-terminal domain-containing protein n=1 Tax=Rhodococcus wratislaviensis NBRC 100605 TaxID=1219028 RepID=X0PKS4_RHOWR|nr:hypothetical protein RW1_005_00950 [Rhodococcus wratislaviensis NBRC 100605]